MTFPADEVQAGVKRLSGEDEVREETSTSQDQLAIIESMYAAFRAQDFDAFAALCAPDLEWIQNDGFPGGGRRIGPRAVFDHVFTANAERWAGFGYEIQRYIKADDTVMVIGHYYGTNKGTDAPFRAAAAHLYELRDGLIARYRQYADTHILSLNSDPCT